MKTLGTISLVMMLLLAACVPIQPETATVGAADTVAATSSTDAGLATLKALLQDPEFALEMASWLDAAYYKGQGEPVPDFLTEEDKTAVKEKSVAEEKIAMNLAGFYALEAGLGVLVERTGESPTAILGKIVDGTLPEEDMLLLARFANATWKAGQPFRALDRITRDAFIPAAMLSQAELEKDFVQIVAAAEKLLEKMQGVADADTTVQLQTVKGLMQDPEFALEMASWLDAAYYKGQGEAVPDFLTEEDKTAVKEKSVAEEKIAMNLAGFYALEAGLGVLVERTGESPKAILTKIADGTLDQKDMLLMARFANATWKAGQPFRALDRVTRDTFIPAAMLSQAELEKDFVQIVAAAEKLLEKMQ